MKIRNGFVSNSSSSSFIVIWESFGPEEMTVAEALSSLFDVFGTYDAEQNYVQPEVGPDGLFPIGEDKWNTENIKAANALIEMTSKENGKFVTTVFTSMKNSSLDYGDDIGRLLTAIMCSERHFRIVHTMERD